MRRAALALVAALAAQPAAASGPEPPPALIEATEAASAQCRELGGTPAILASYQTVADLNGDGREDFVTDLAGLQCDGAWSAFCGSAGCPVAAWLSAPGGAHARFDLGELQGFEIVDGAPLPTLRAAYHASRCGEDRSEGCTRSWTFASNAPETPTADPAPAREAPAPAGANGATPPGWTLRAVPGSSPVALGMGTGNVATLAAFCLEGQPFLAVTFHERPAADQVPLGFAFSQGPVEATAAFEETAGGAYVVALADGPLAARLAGRDSEVAMAVGGEAEGVLSLEGSTRALRGALGECHAL
jgi:hypothetical protein